MFRKRTDAAMAVLTLALNLLLNVLSFVGMYERNWPPVFVYDVVLGIQIHVLDFFFIEDERFKHGVVQLILNVILYVFDFSRRFANVLVALHEHVLGCGLLFSLTIIIYACLIYQCIFVRIMTRRKCLRHRLLSLPFRHAIFLYQDAFFDLNICQ